VRGSEEGTEGEEELKSAKVLLVGVGGVGCPAAQYLAAAVVGHIGLLDHDVVDITNLHRQILFSEHHIGRPKAEVAKEVLAQQNSEVSFEVYVERLSKENAIEIVREYDVILDGSDNFQTKYLINDVCVLLDKPFVGASIYKYQGQLSVFNYKNGPTYRCLYPNHHFKDNNNCEDTGVIGVLPGLLGVMQATEAVKMILGIGKVLSGKMKLVDTLNNADRLIEFRRNQSQIELVKKRSLQLEQITCDLNDAQQTYLDVREPFEEPKLRSAKIISIPLNQLSARHSEIPREDPVHVFCQSGIRSKKAITYLTEELGFINLVDVEGGVLSLIPG